MSRYHFVVRTEDGDVHGDGEPFWTTDYARADRFAHAAGGTPTYVEDVDRLSDLRGMWGGIEWFHTPTARVQAGVSCAPPDSGVAPIDPATVAIEEFGAMDRPVGRAMSAAIDRGNPRVIAHIAAARLAQARVDRAPVDDSIDPDCEPPFDAMDSILLRHGVLAVRGESLHERGDGLHESSDALVADKDPHVARAIHEDIGAPWEQTIAVGLSPEAIDEILGRVDVWRPFPPPQVDPSHVFCASEINMPGAIARHVALQARPHSTGSGEVELSQFFSVDVGVSPLHQRVEVRHSMAGDTFRAWAARVAEHRAGSDHQPETAAPSM